MNYAGQATFGVTTDLASVPEAGDLAGAIVDEITRLQPAGPGRRRRPGATAARVAQLS